MVTSMFRKALVVAAIAAAVLAVAAGASAGRVSRAGSDPVQVAFVRAADGNCRALGQLLAPLGNPKTLPGIARKLSVVVPAFAMALRAQAELGAPVGEAGLVKRWMAAMTSYGDELSAIQAAAAGGDGAVVTKANERLTAIGGKAATLSKQLGLRVCFQS